MRREGSIIFNSLACKHTNITPQKSEYAFISLLPGEQLLTIQRPHWIALSVLFLSHIFVAGIICFVTFEMLIQDFFPIPFSLLADGILIFISLLALLGTYTCMTWYFTFYIVTTKRLIIRKFFKIIGTYFQEVLVQHGTDVEIKRVSKNFLYDLLDIEDIHVDLPYMEIPEPFVFTTPQHPELIEKAIFEIENQMIT